MTARPLDKVNRLRRGAGLDPLSVAFIPPVVSYMPGGARP